MSQRLYLPPERLAQAAPGQALELDRTRSHYLTNVLRLKAGAALACFDGVGREWQASVLRAGRSVVLELGPLRREQSAPATPLTLAAAWLKGAAMDTVVQKATELGASAITVLSSERSNVRVDDKRAASKRRHWQGIIISAAEQSGRLHLPELRGPTTLEEALAGSAEERRIFLDPGAETLDVGTAPQAMTLLVGPEGGWSEAERKLAKAHGAEPAGLGELVLRAETAPLAALAAIRHSWGWRA